MNLPNKLTVVRVIDDPVFCMVHASVPRWRDGGK